MASEAEQSHHRGVSKGLADFWMAQSRLIEASRRAATDADAARQARALLAGEAQQAYLRVRVDIAAWGTHLEQSAVQQAGQARQAAHLVVQAVWALGALAALALAVGWALLRWPLRPASGLAAADAADSGLPQRLRSGIDPHLQTLNVAVATARRGEPGRGAGLSAQEANQLADQVAAAAQGLRKLVDRPRTTEAPAAAPSDTSTSDNPRR
jgi:hypothetical protein